jgi:hypothetical protein
MLPFCATADSAGLAQKVTSAQKLITLHKNYERFPAALLL